MTTTHVARLEDEVTTDQPQLWQPLVGEETIRLLAASDLDTEAAGRVERQAAKILGRCVPPQARTGTSRTGLVVGYVQSGKTLSFTALTALARDNGYRLVVLFSGTKEVLHEQTASRLAHDLEVERDGGLSPWRQVQDPDGNAQVVSELATTITAAADPTVPEEFRRTLVLTVMKTPARLRKLRETFERLGTHGLNLRDVPVLVVDDEADQAGLNALASKDDATATYREIVRLRAVLPHHSYVMYTATPQAPLLVNLADVLSPDFVAVLEPGDAYTGGQHFFVEHKERFLERLSVPEEMLALDPSVLEPPESLQRALATFFLGVAVRRRGPISMLIHPSHATDLHDKYRRWVNQLVDDWAATLKQPGLDRDALVEDHFGPAHADLFEGRPDAPSLEALLADVPHWMTVTGVLMVNSSTDTQKISWKANPAWILVGGNKLDRGFTVEGLTVTYMPRGAGVGNADTIQQRARFFGYKQSYSHLCRAWLAQATASAFESYVEHEEILRTQLQRAAREGKSLKAWKRWMLLDPALKPCRRSVIDLDLLRSAVKGDAWSRYERLNLPPDLVDTNRTRLDAFLDEHRAAASTAPGDPREKDRHLVMTVPLAQLLDRVLADWTAHPEDQAALNQVVLLLGTRLDQDPHLQADVYLVDGGSPRRRSLREDGVRVVNLMQGRNASGYPGDAEFHGDSVVSLQVHRVTVAPSTDAPPLLRDVPGLALWVPQRFASAVLQQV